MMLLRSLLTLAIFMQLAGCGYHFSGSGENTIATGQSVWISFIRNESTSSIAQTVLRRALFEESHRLRGLFPAVSESDAELVVNGTLLSYSSKAVSYTGSDRAREYRLMLNVELEIRRKGVNAPLWKGNLQSYQDFPASDNLALQQNAEEAALAAASRIIAHKMLVASEQAY